MRFLIPLLLAAYSCTLCISPTFAAQRCATPSGAAEYQDGYRAGCLYGFRNIYDLSRTCTGAAVPSYSGNASKQSSWSTGCTQGWNEGQIAMKNNLADRGTDLSGIADACSSSADANLNAATDPALRQKYVAGCEEAYIAGANADTSVCLGVPFSGSYYDRGCTEGTALAAHDAASAGSGSGSGATGGGVVTAPSQLVPADCKPWLSPSQPGACGINKFLELVKNLIRYLTVVAFPLAALMIGWGGFQVMTAAGSAEQVSKGWKSIRIAAFGIVFVLTSYLVIQFIVQVLGVPTGPSGYVQFK